jgi:hypothetical protein
MIIAAVASYSSEGIVVRCGGPASTADGIDQDCDGVDG